MSQVLLVRHGQASWGAEDYDQLSERGVEQSRLLGAALVARGVRPDAMVSGGMRRHRQTADALRTGAGWDLPVEVDAGWDELDHQQVLDRQPAPDGVDATTPQGFQRWFEAATDRWASGEHADYTETFTGFVGRVEDALAAAVATARGSGRAVRAGRARGGTVVVVTSGGPMGWVAACLLGGDAGLWRRLNQVTVNTGVTKVVAGARGPTLLTLNEHSHLPADLVTYR